jgi:O-antigen/teichoic acid export membrane protein
VSQPSLGRHVALSFGPTILALVTGLVAVPVILSTLGPSTWAAVAVGQAVGYFSSQFVGWGWSAVGASAVAARSPQEQAQYVADSVGPRLWLLSVAFPVGCVAAYLVAPPGGHVWLCVAQAAALIPGGLNGMFYYTGSSRPDLTILLDAVPRAVATVLGLTVLILTKNMFWYIALQFVCDVVLIWFFVRRATGFGARFDLGRAHAWRMLREQRAAVLITTATNAIGQLPITIVSAFRLPSIATYALADRIRGYAAGALGPLVGTAQGRLHSPDRATLHHRIRVALRAWSVAAVVVAVGFVFAASWVGRLLSHNSIRIQPAIAIPFAMTLGLVIMTDFIGGAALLALGRVHDVARSWSFAAVVGLPLVAVGAWTYGTTGAAVGVSGIQAIATAWQWWRLEALLRQEGEQVASVPALDEGRGEFGEPLV